MINGKKKGIKLKLPISNIISNPWFEFSLRIILGTVFIYSSLHKIIHPKQFAEIIYGYNLFPLYTINLMAITIPFAELVTGTGIICNIYPKASSIIIISLLTGFIISISVNMISGHKFDCGCFSFGKTDNSATWQLLLRDILFFCTSVFIFFYKQNRKCLFKKKNTPNSS